MRRLQFLSVFMAAVVSTSVVAQGGIFVGAQLVPSSTPTGDSIDSVFAGDPATVDIALDVSYPGEFEETPQVYRGSAFASATVDTYKLRTQLELSNYHRENYVWRDDGRGNPVVTTPATSTVTLNDSITVNGGEGVYSLNYLLSLEGLIQNSGDPTLSGAIQISLSIPEGDSGATTFFVFTAYSEIPSEITLSYDDLPFGGPVTPTLAIYAFAFVSPLSPEDVETQGQDLISGSTSIEFGSTIRLLELSATDANGNKIPGLTFSSASGLQYPTDPANLLQVTPGAVPEPETWVLAAPLAGLALVALVRRERNRRRSARPSEVL